MPKPATTTAPKHPDLIDLDADLSLAAQTMKAAAPEARPKWKALIDRLLDRRLELMRRHSLP